MSQPAENSTFFQMINILMKILDISLTKDICYIRILKILSVLATRSDVDKVH